MHVPTVTSPKVEQLKSYIAANTGRCKGCKSPVFWVSSAGGKRIPMDFPNATLRPKTTHELIMGFGPDGWDGSVEAWPRDGQTTHTCHLATCTKRDVTKAPALGVDGSDLGGVRDEGSQEPSSVRCEICNDTRVVKHSDGESLCPSCLSGPEVGHCPRCGGLDVLICLVGEEVMCGDCRVGTRAERLKGAQ